MAASNPADTVVCSPWCTVDDVPAAVQAKLGADAVALLTQAIAIASDTLYALTGRRWRGQCTNAVQLTPCRGPAPRVGRHTVCAFTQLQLPDYPVTAITTVLDEDAAAVPADRFRLVGGRALEHLTADGARDSWPAGTYEVTYSHGQDPPYAGAIAAASYAGELALARAGADGCRLPKRVQSVTRQGVSFVLLDSFDYLDKGRVGLPEVDTWITAVNPRRLARRPGVWSPDTSTTRTEHI